MKIEVQEMREIKEYKVKNYKTMFLVVYKIFGGIILKRHLRDLCLKYKYFSSEDVFNKVIASLEDLQLIETTFIPGSEAKILKLKQFAVDQIEGKRTRAVPFSTERVYESFIKYRLISTSKILNSQKDSRLEDFYDTILKHTTFWSKEKSPVLINTWIDGKYTLTEEGKEAVDRGIEFEEKRSKNFKQNKDKNVEEQEKKPVTALDFMELNKNKKKEYTTSVDFSKIRNRGGFINDLPSLIQKRHDYLNIDAIITSQDAPDFKSIATYIFDCIYVSSQQLENINHLYINFRFLDIQQLNFSFNSCFEYGRDEKGIIKDNRNVLDRINTYSKSKLNTPFKPFKQGLNREKYSAELAYKLRFGSEYKIEDREIVVHLSFTHVNLYRDLYGAEKADAMIAVSKSRAEERREERKEKDATVTYLTKLHKNGSLDKLVKLATELSDREIDKLIKLIKD